jgi:hypothetical protein
MTEKPRQANSRRSKEALAATKGSRPDVGCGFGEVMLRDGEEDEAYLAADSGNLDALDITERGEVGLDLEEHEGEFVVTWIDIGSGESTEMETIEGGGVVKSAAQSPSPYAAAIVWK